VPRSYDSIESDIAKARDDLATTLDEIVDRVSPRRLAEEGQAKAKILAQDPRVLAAVGGVVALVLAGVVGGSVKKRRQRRRVEQYLAAHR